MQRIQDKVIYAATDLVRFLACRHVTTLDLVNLETPLAKAVDDESLRLIQNLGHEHERNYLGELKQKPNTTVSDIPTDLSLEERTRLTKEAMVRGDDVIYQAAFLDNTWLGFADFLKKVPAKTKLGDYGYEAVDTKLARSEKPEYVIQLALYSEQIAEIQGVMPTHMHVVLGDGEEVPFRVSEFEHYFRRAKQRFEKFAGSKAEKTVAEPCTFCTYCRWRDICTEEWERVDHLSLVANITKHQIKKLREQGINTLAVLAEMPKSTRIPRMPEEILRRLQSQAALHLKARKTGERYHEIVPTELGRGFDRLPKPDDGDIFFDIEGDPLYPDKLEYLFGCLHVDKGKEVLLPIWAHDHEEEKQAVARLLRFFTDHLTKHPKAHIYHYAAYEVTALKRLTAKYGVAEFELDQLLRGHRFVDLYKVVREGVRTSEPNSSIKSIEKFYMQARETEIAAGGDSIVAYERFRETGDKTEIENIWAYNQDDLKSTLLLQGWLIKIRPDSADWYTTSVAEVDPKKLEAHLTAEQERETLSTKLLKRAPDTEKHLRILTADLIDFHRRADKPVWWSLFDKADWETDELIDDPESIGGLVADPKKKPEPIAKSLLYSFRVPSQDAKLDIGSQCKIAATTSYAGTIHEMDLEAGMIAIKRGKSQEPLPEALSLIGNGPLENENAPLAIRRFAQSLIAGSHSYRAAEALLSRSVPRITGHKEGQAVISGKRDIISEAVDAVSKLDQSCLFIQGPPGSGKTTTSAAIIFELLKQGRKIGVASNSHKAINNLLAKVDDSARKAGLKFRGLKKSSEAFPDSLLNGKIIKDTFKYPEPDDFDLIGGTAWLFTKPEYDQCLDYLFIDEAGQVALANVVAMGLSAKNIVLVGDQMQLGQPIQGVHPGDSGFSVLEYLLKDQATIPPDRGIFLPITWRLNPAVCKFISDAVYDSRLEPHARTAGHSLILTGETKAQLKSEGIQFIEVEHQGCSQKSEEEGEVVKNLYGRLLKQRYTIDGAKKSTLTMDDILVVAPYNVQVNHLKSILPDGARVGTVDKFQGQEAQVVIVSMTTSSAEDMPRNLEFLLSKNRLNVAISRAKALAVLIASPALLEVPCSNVEQMRLANTLCWARAYA